MADFASRLRELRNSRGMRQKDLALALGLAQTTIANYEQKSRFPDEATLGRIAAHFNTSLDYLLGRTDVNVNLQGLTPPPAGGPREEEAPLGEPARESLQLMLAGHVEQAAGLVHGLLPAGRSLGEVYLQVFSPALKEAGRLWSQGKLDVAREHLLSESTLGFMSQLLAAAQGEAAARKGLSCLCLAVCEEQHLIGVRMLADLLELDGWTTLFLGGSVCTQHVLRALADYQPHLLALSVTLPEHLGYAEELIRAARSSPGLQRVKILLGGQAFRQQGELWRAMGADGSAEDAAEAVTLANRLADGR